MIKKTISLALVLLMTVSLVACGNTPEQPTTVKASNGVEIAQYTGIEATMTEYVITEEFIDYQLTEITKQYSSLENITEGVVAAGNMLTISYDSYVGEQLLEDASAKELSFTLGEGKFVDAFENALIGTKIGETFEFAIQYPVGSTYSILDGKTVIHRGTVHYVSNVVYPEVTDDFIKTHVKDSYSKPEAACTTVAEYREYLKNRYEFVYARKSREALVYDLLDALMKDSILPEIPDSDLDAYENGKYDYYVDYCSQNGFTIDTYLKSQEISEEEFRASLRKDGELVIKQTWLLQAIEELENITLSEARYNEYLEYLVEYYQFDDVAQLKESIIELGSEDIVRSDARYEAIYDYIIEHAKLTIEKVDMLEEAKAGDLK